MGKLHAQWRGRTEIFRAPALTLSLTLLVLLAAVSCGGSGAGSLTAGSESGTAPASLPAPPAGPARSSIDRSASTYNFSAVDLIASSHGSFDGETLTLDGSQGTAWALIGTNAAPPLVPPTGMILVGSASQLWVGASNFFTNRWDWLGGPLEISSVKNMALPTATMRNGSGSFYVALVVPQGGSASLQLSCDLVVPNPNGGNWNLAVWIAGDNNLAPEALGDLNELETVGSTDNVRILAGYDIDPSWVGGAQGIDEAHFIKVVQDSNDNAVNTSGDPANQSFPRAGFNSADPAKLVQFLDWVEANFPADHTALVLWDHGDGWRLGSGGAALSHRHQKPKHSPAGYRLLSHTMPTAFDPLVRQTSGVLSDDTDGGFALTGNQAIVSALGSRHFDMILMDACNMGQLEAVYDYHTVADYVVASECLVPGAGYPYTAALQSWNSGFPMAPEAIGASFVDAVQSYYSGTGEYVSHGVFKSTDVVQLANNLSAFAAAVEPKAGTEADNVKNAMVEAFEPDFGDGTRDVEGFLTAYSAATTDTELKGLADTALASCQSATRYFKQFDQDSSNGLSVFLPSSSYYDPLYTDEYALTKFNEDTGWLDLFAATGVPDSGGGSGFGGSFNWDIDWAPGDVLSIDWVGNADNEIDLEMREPGAQAWQLVGPYDGSGGTPNLTFSEDSYYTDLPTEYIQLNNGAATGTYEAYLWWYDFSGFGTTYDVHVELLDSSFNVKQDLGTVSIGEAWTNWRCAKLTLN